MLQIDSFAYNSKLLWNAPGAKIAFGAIPLVLCLFFESIAVSILTLALMGIATIYYSGVTVKQYLKLLLLPFGFLVIGTLTIVFVRTQPGEALVGFPLFSSFYGITASSLRMGMILVLKALGAVSCMYFISLNTAMNDILEFLHSIKLPNLIVSLTELIYRYIFVILEESSRMYIAGASRLGYSGFKNSLQATGEMAGGLFIRAYMRCDRIYEALQSRGYEGEFKHMAQEYLPSGMLWAMTAAVSTTLLATGLAERLFF